MIERIKTYYVRQRAAGRGPLTVILELPGKALRRWRSRNEPPKHNVTYGHGLFDKPLLASYSRSGTNWVRYILESVSDRPTPGQTRLHGGEDYLLDRAHRAYPIMHRHPRVILMLRDYRECLLRHNAAAWEEFGEVETFLTSSSIRHPPLWYVRNLAAFHHFEGPKLLAYYEDLLTQPELEIPRLCAFLGLDPERTRAFLEEIDAHAARSVSAYTSGGHASVTAGGQDFTRHRSERLTREQAKAFDSFYAQHYSELFETYLRRYALL